MKFCPICEEEKNNYCIECVKKANKYSNEKTVRLRIIPVKCGLDSCTNIIESKGNRKKFCSQKCKNKFHNSKPEKKDNVFKYRFKEKFLKKKEPKKRNFKRWTKKEVTLLLEKKDEGLTYRQIATLLKRSSDACNSKMKEILSKSK